MAFCRLLKLTKRAFLSPRNLGETVIPEPAGLVDIDCVPFFAWGRSFASAVDEARKISRTAKGNESSFFIQITLTH